jgi:hypothetical protein
MTKVHFVQRLNAGRVWLLVVAPEEWKLLVLLRFAVIPSRCWKNRLTWEVLLGSPP